MIMHFYQCNGKKDNYIREFYRKTSHKLLRPFQIVNNEFISNEDVMYMKITKDEKECDYHIFRLKLSDDPDVFHIECGNVSRNPEFPLKMELMYTLNNPDRLIHEEKIIDYIINNFSVDYYNDHVAKFIRLIYYNNYIQPNSRYDQKLYKAIIYDKTKLCGEPLKQIKDEVILNYFKNKLDDFLESCYLMYKSRLCFFIDFENLDLTLNGELVLKSLKNLFIKEKEELFDFFEKHNFIRHLCKMCNGENDLEIKMIVIVQTIFLFITCFCNRNTDYRYGTIHMADIKNTSVEFIEQINKERYDESTNTKVVANLFKIYFFVNDPNNFILRGENCHLLLDNVRNTLLLRLKNLIKNHDTLFRKLTWDDLEEVYNQKLFDMITAINQEKYKGYSFIEDNWDNSLRKFTTITHTDNRGNVIKLRLQGNQYGVSGYYRSFNHGGKTIGVKIMQRFGRNESLDILMYKNIMSYDNFIHRRHFINYFHPNLMEVYKIGTIGSLYDYILCEHVQQDLEPHHITRGSVFEQLRNVIEEYLYKKLKIGYTDIKLLNVKYDITSSRVKLIDFGSMNDVHANRGKDYIGYHINSYMTSIRHNERCYFFNEDVIPTCIELGISLLIIYVIFPRARITLKDLEQNNERYQNIKDPKLMLSLYNPIIKQLLDFIKQQVDFKSKKYIEDSLIKTIRENEEYVKSLKTRPR